jgi:hypothetical protein
MSQHAVEILLGRLITDEAFRHAFYADPTTVCARESLELTAGEIDALLALDCARLRVFAGALDERIVRAPIGGPYAWRGADRPHAALRRSDAEAPGPGRGSRRERRPVALAHKR